MTSILLKKLNRFRILFWVIRLLSRVLRLLPVLLGLTVLYAAGSGFLYYTSGTASFFRTFLLLILSTGCVLECARLFLSHSKTVTLSLQIEKNDPSLKNTLSNAVQFSRQIGQHKGDTSLLEMAVEQGEQKSENLRLRKHLPEWRPSRINAVSSLVFLTALTFLFFYSGNAGQAIKGLVDPDVFARKEQGFKVTPGNTTVVSGDSLKIGISNRNGETVRLDFSPKRAAAVSRVRYISFDSAFVTFKQIQTPLDYHVQSLHRTGKPYRIDVVRRPEIDSLQVTVHYPAYMEKKKDILEADVGNCTVPRGARVRFQISASKELMNAHLVTGDSSRKEMQISGREADLEIRIRKPLSYSFMLTDRDSLKNTGRITYTIQLERDEIPAVTMIIPETDVRLDRSLKIPLRIAIEDDFGVSKTRLHYRIIREDGTDTHDSLELKQRRRNVRLDTIDTEWDLEPLGIYPGEIVEFRISATDNDVYTGPKTAWSAVRKARFPTAREIFEETERHEEMLASGLQDIQRRQQQMGRKTEKLKRKLQSSKSPDWKESDQISRLSKEQKELLRDIDSLGQAIREKYTDMFSDDQYRKNVMRKIEEIREQMEKMDFSKLENMLKRHAQTDRPVDMKKLREMLDRMAAKQKDVFQDLSQTLEMLKKIQSAEKMASMARMMNEMAARQDSLNVAKSKNQENLSGTSAKQKQLMRELEEMLKQMDALAENSALDSATRQSVRDVAADLRKMDAAGKMQAAAMQMQEKKLKQAEQNQNKAGQMLRESGGKMDALAAAFQQKSNLEFVKALENTARRLLFLSFSQESLSVSMNRETKNFQESMTMVLEEIVSQLITIGETAGFTDPILMGHLGRAIQQSRQAEASLERINPKAVSFHQVRTEESINAAVIRLNDFLDQLQRMSSGQGASLGEMMQSLFSLSGEQMMVNGMMQDILAQAMQGSMSTEARSQRRRIAAQQKSIAKRYKELEEELKKSPEWHGRSAELKKEMKEVIRSMEQGDYSGETLKKQERILSRMLEGAQSISKRDYSKKRKAEREKQNYTVSRPAEIQSDRLKNAAERKKPHLKSYPREYHDLIRSYFRNLTSEE